MTFSAALGSGMGLFPTTPNPFKYSLTAGGGELISMVPVDSVNVTEAGLGVSTLAFDLEEPTAGTVDIADGAQILMHDITRNRPVFRGSLESVSPVPWAAVGRHQRVTAAGDETLLDTVIIPSLVVDAGGGSSSGAAMQEVQLVQLLAGFAPLRAFSGGPLGSDSTLDTPVAAWTSRSLVDGTATVDLSGLSIRAAFNKWLENATLFAGTHPQPPLYLGVDPWGGVRLFPWGGGTPFATSEVPSDYTDLVIGAGIYPAGALEFTEDHSAGSIVNAVFVKGAAAASTGWVVGDTTGPRREVYVTTDGTSADAKLAAASELLNSGGPKGRGSFRLENFDPGNHHAGGRVIITDTLMGWSSKTFLITSIDKTFRQGPQARQDWTVYFMDPGRSPSAGPGSVAYGIAGRRV